MDSLFYIKIYYKKSPVNLVTKADHFGTNYVSSWKTLGLRGDYLQYKGFSAVVIREKNVCNN